MKVPTPLKEIIANLLSGQGTNIDLSGGKVLEVWSGVVGPGISNNTRPLFIKDGILTVAVEDSIWLQELNFLKNEIKDKLNERLGKEAVREIKFRVGKG